MNKKLILMRGTPGSGKSFTAKKLAGEKGLIFSTDEFWYTKVNSKEPEVYNFKPNLLDRAHKWNFVRTTLAINEGSPLIIIDNTNVRAKDFCCTYLKYAHFQGYEVEFQEPESDWWQIIRELLIAKQQNKQELTKWAEILAEKNTHQVPAFAIERMFMRWDNFLTPQSVLDDCLAHCDAKNTINATDKSFDLI